MSTYHSFLPSHLRPFRVVIRKIHYSTVNSDISEVLATLSHTVTSIWNILKLKVALPLFYVCLKPAENNNDVFKNYLYSVFWLKFKIHIKLIGARFNATIDKPTVILDGFASSVATITILPNVAKTKAAMYVMWRWSHGELQRMFVV